MVGRFTTAAASSTTTRIEGRRISVRYVWSDITPTSAHFEQGFSADDGETWEANWISTITRTR